MHLSAADSSSFYVNGKSVHHLPQLNTQAQIQISWSCVCCVCVRVRRRTNSFPLGKSRNIATRVWALVPPSSGSFLPMPASFLHKDSRIYGHHCAQLPNNYIATQSNAVQVSGGREQDKEKQTSMKLTVVISIFLKKKTHYATSTFGVDAKISRRIQEHGHYQLENLY